ncbi:acyl-CoA dehydrogenase family protein [Saccharopolyspora shandongensis]|uniref:acyl-CoA dehydrogenase family protein n=1 Tax=Saccharopolyspora shandongensis TaxID=418495 RepID=UPI0033CD1B05
MLDAQAADLILVSARIEGEGLAWFAVDSSAVECLPLAAYDLTRRQCRVRLVSCPARRLAGTGEASVRRVLDMAALALAVEELGGAAACLDAATEYAKVRVQFGRAIGSFQAVKHRLADTLIELELTRSLVEDCVSTVASKREDVSLLGSLAKVSASSTYQRIAGDNIQVHGGIGYTWEHDAQLYFKRAFSGAGLFGTLDQHRDNLAARAA